MLFYDPATIRAHGDFIEVWAKSVPTDVIDGAVENPASRPEIDQETGRRILAGYIPPMVPLLGETAAGDDAFKEAVQDATSAEVAVEVGDLKIHWMIRFEIDCRERKIRQIQSAEIDSHGRFAGVGAPTDFEAASADPTSDRIVKVVCSWTK